MGHAELQGAVEEEPGASIDALTTEGTPDGHGPACEAFRRREGIDEWAEQSEPVLAHVLQHVDEGAADLARPLTPERIARVSVASTMRCRWFDWIE